MPNGKANFIFHLLILTNIFNDRQHIFTDHYIRNKYIKYKLLVQIVTSQKLDGRKHKKELQLSKRTTTPRPLPVAPQQGRREGAQRVRRFSVTGMQRQEDDSVSPDSWGSREG